MGHKLSLGEQAFQCIAKGGEHGSRSRAGRLGMAGDTLRVAQAFMPGIKELPFDVETRRDRPVALCVEIELLHHAAQLQGGLIPIVFTEHHVFHAENGIALLAQQAAGHPAKLFGAPVGELTGCQHGIELSGPAPGKMGGKEKAVKRDGCGARGGQRHSLYGWGCRAQLRGAGA